MSGEIASTHVVDWLRSRAQMLQDMADTLETTFAVTTHHWGPTEVLGTQIDSIKQLMESRAMRVGDIQLATRMPRHELEKLITHENGFVVGERGWVRVMMDHRPESGREEEFAQAT